MEKNNNGLFSEFPSVSVKDWKAVITDDLKGSDYEKKLVNQTIENIKTQPFYTAEDLAGMNYLNSLPGEYPFIRGNKKQTNHWEIRQDFRVFDFDAVREKYKMALERGVDAVGFNLTDKTDLHRNNIKKLISGFDFDQKSLHLIAGNNSMNVMDLLLNSLTELNVKPSSVKGSLAFDPIGYCTSAGRFYISPEQDMVDSGKLLSQVAHEMPGFRIIAVNSTVFSNSGASAVQELGYGISMMSEYFTHLIEAGHTAREITGHIQWNLGIGSDYFMEIAKIRAARLLFSAMLSAYDMSAAEKNSVYIHSITTRWNKTAYDPNVNMLRLTTEAMSAILGGCNSLLVEPYDACFRYPGEQAERLARNIQIILKNESYFDKVIDPAAGSYYLEHLTETLAEQSWELFLRTDANGGYLQALKNGLVTSDIKATRSKRMDMINTRKEILVGTNQYPSMTETIAGQIDSGIAYEEDIRSEALVSEPLKAVRVATEFEKLRIEVENFQGKKPLAFMLTIGNLGMRLARSQFSCNFFACGGYGVKDNLGFLTPEQGVNEAMIAGADIIVICSSDDEYASVAPEVNRLVNGRALVVVAGAPTCMEELKQQGITEFIHMRSNVLVTLQHFNQLLGIAKNI